MNAYLLAATILLLALFPLLLATALKRPLDGLVALETGAALTTLALLLLAAGFHRSVYFSLALVLVVGSFGGSLVLARFFDRLE